MVLQCCNLPPSLPQEAYVACHVTHCIHVICFGTRLVGLNLSLSADVKVSGKEGSSRQVRLSLRSTKKATLCLHFLFTGYSFPALAVLPRSGLFMAPQPLHPSPSLCTGGRSTSTLAFRPRVIFPLLPLQPQSLPKMNPVPTRSHLFFIKPKSNCDLVPLNP